MNETVKGIWELRRERENSTGRPVEIYSAYPLIGRGTVHHDQFTHKAIEEKFNVALFVPWWKRIVYFINRTLVHA